MFSESLFIERCCKPVKPHFVSKHLMLFLLLVAVKKEQELGVWVLVGRLLELNI